VPLPGEKSPQIGAAKASQLETFQTNKPQHANLTRLFLSILKLNPLRKLVEEKLLKQSSGAFFPA
jgi:hypothetical protein